jgi:hypothetical protein
MKINMMINYRMYEVNYDKVYFPLYLIDLRVLDIRCEISNTFLFFIENPRVNIELVSGFFEFYYNTIPGDETLGQVLSKALITYRLGDEANAVTEMTPCVIFTKGLKILELLIYMPTNDLVYIRELQYSFLPKLEAECVICMEDRKDVINIHQNNYEHYVCMSCVLQIKKCPICREAIK